MLDEKDIKKFEELIEPLASKDDLRALVTKEDLKGEVEGLAVMMKNSFDYVDKRFDKIENILLKQQNDKIEKLEERMHRLEEALALK